MHFVCRQGEKATFFRCLVSIPREISCFVPRCFVVVVVFFKKKIPLYAEHAGAAGRQQAATLEALESDRNRKIIVRNRWEQGRHFEPGIGDSEELYPSIGM